MPAYIYKCPTCHSTRTVFHRMDIENSELCHCGQDMHRVPQPFSVNWNGPPPSAGGKHHLVEKLNATYDERRDKFAKRKAEHVERTESENR